ncbi:MAG: hypothetical protein KDK91_23220 [Gammaproteobacteria bacterium]|nr:hypothetical protein [Gammaproteobacteria bacterium]
MAVYSGDRTIDGISVLVDGKALDEAVQVHRFSDNGFEWTYEGRESQQLALAILHHHLGDAGRALALSERFMQDVIANLDNTWEMSSADVDAFLAEAQTG